ncbi:MAG: GGDEF domain-containing protein [Clostridiales bacterium]|nr:GGDEF domain-containing protein [Clostridiales bacterium]
MDLYSAIVFITFAVSTVTAVNVFANQLVSKDNKFQILTVCALICIASLCEWLGIKTEYMSASLIGLHKLAKLAEFCLAPCISIAAAVSYGEVKRKKLIYSALGVHIIFEILALFNNWVFSVDAQNIYHREQLYWVYIAVFSLSIIYCFICIVRGIRKYQARLGISLLFILGFLAFGIALQMIKRNIRVDFMCVAIGNLMLYSYRGNVINQIDVTTRLMNRRCFERITENMKSPAYVLFFDVNKFKHINDTFGHTEGDKYLRLVAKKIYDIYGKYGFCYRIGGDEFCVVMFRNLDKLQALNLQFKYETDRLFINNIHTPGVALGWAYYNSDTTDINTVIDKADEKMYKDKHQLDI